MEADELFENILGEIEPDKEEFMSRRLKHINFSRVIVWLCIKSRDNDFVYGSDLTKFIKLDRARVHSILNDLVNNKILRKRSPMSNLVEYWFIKEHGIPIVQSYFEKSKNTLGIKAKLTLTNTEQ